MNRLLPLLYIDCNSILDRRALRTQHWVVLVNCAVHQAGTLKEAKEILEKIGSSLFLAICDLHLPDADEGAVIDQIASAKVPCIAITGKFDSGLREVILKKGAIDYVVKNSLNAFEYLTDLTNRLYKNKSYKALVVDDASSARVLLSRMLQMLQFEVIGAENGLAALEQLQQNPDIRLVLTDYNMPGMDGFGLINEIRKTKGKDKIAIIGLSSSNNENLTAQFLKIGANDFLSKPYSYEELSCRVNQNMEMLEHIYTIRDVANRNYLTGLYNRRYFFETGGAIHGRAQKRGTSLVTAMMDIDHFKRVNDTYGHDAGDVVLKHMASLLANYFKDHLLARLGGEEFALLISSSSLEDTFQLFDHFRQEVALSPAGCGEHQISFTVSIGLSNQLQNNMDEMLKLADENLYQAKETCRNQVVKNW